MNKETTIEINEIGVGDLVSFGRPNSKVEPAVGHVTKVNRQTYQIRLIKPYHQVRRTYPQGARFRVSKPMVHRYLCASQWVSTGNEGDGVIEGWVVDEDEDEDI